MTHVNIPDHVKAWTDQIRTQGFDALWNRMSEAEREEFEVFSRDFAGGFQFEVDCHWQEAADCYKSLAERFPAFADIAISRASQVVSDKINRAIRYYNQGVQSIEAKQYSKALQYFELALNVDKHMEKALYNLGMTHRMIYVSNPEANRGNKISAVDTFRRLLGVNPRHAKALAQIESLSQL